MKNILDFILIIVIFGLYMIYMDKLSNKLLRKYYAKNWVERSAKKPFLGFRQLDFIRVAIFIITIAFAKLIVFLLSLININLLF